MLRFVGLFFCSLALTTICEAMPEGNAGVLDQIKTGLKYATNYLETAKDIADLVSKSLGHKQDQKRGDEKEEKTRKTFGPSNIVSAFFRLFGLDSQKVTAIAVNSVIFLAQMIGSLFDLKQPAANIARDLEDDDTESSWNPARLILESKNERIQNLMRQAQDQELSNQLIERMDGFDSACIRLLLCKTSPIIKAAQNSLTNKTQGKPHTMTSWIPGKDVFERNSDECEDNHTDCSLFPE